MFQIICIIFYQLNVRTPIFYRLIRIYHTSLQAVRRAVNDAAPPRSTACHKVEIKTRSIADNLQIVSAA